jgi:uncharacterized protein YktA (UPF0223 family)
MKSFLLGMVLMSPILAFGQDVCPVPNTLNDILECLKDKHQLIRLKGLTVQSTQDLSKVMGQTPNPILDVQTVHSGNNRQTQIILGQELDLGGKLKALRAKGSLIHQMNQNELAIAKEDVIEEVLLNLHHLMHLNETLEVNREINTSLGSVLNALKRKPALSPEQEASFLNFKLKQAELNNIMSLLLDQEEEILMFFTINGGYQKQVIVKVMKDHYHPLDVKKSSGSLSLNLERLGLEAKMAEKELDLQKAVPWQGISIGPMFMDDKMEVISEKLYGVAFTMPIPVWQTNSAGKAMASIQYKNTNTQFSLFKKKEGIQKDSFLYRIDSLKMTLDKLPDENELLRNHQRIEKLYTQGLITPTSFLDSHRIWRDVVSSKLELEEKILKLSIDYYRLTGKLNEVHL